MFFYNALYISFQHYDIQLFSNIKFDNNIDDLYKMITYCVINEIIQEFTYFLYKKYNTFLIN